MTPLVLDVLAKVQALYLGIIHAKAFLALIVGERTSNTGD
jgi:hypothetical protein